MSLSSFRWICENAWECSRKRVWWYFILLLHVAQLCRVPRSVVAISLSCLLSSAQGCSGPTSIDWAYPVLVKEKKRDGKRKRIHQCAECGSGVAYPDQRTPAQLLATFGCWASGQTKWWMQTWTRRTCGWSLRLSEPTNRSRGEWNRWRIVPTHSCCQTARCSPPAPDVLHKN